MKFTQRNKVIFVKCWSLKILVIATLIAFCMLGCDKEPIDQELWTERAINVLQPFKQRLMGALAEGLQEGPEKAIEVCQVLAPSIAAEISSAGVEVGRTSHKLRNRNNAPRDWVKPILETYAMTPGDSEPKIIRIGQGRIGYVEPIYVNSMCLVCHGSTLSPSIASRIDEHYPEDKARNFEEGDFRGLFWVEFNERQIDSE